VSHAVTGVTVADAGYRLHKVGTTTTGAAIAGSAASALSGARFGASLELFTPLPPKPKGAHLRRHLRLVLEMVELEKAHMERYALDPEDEEAGNRGPWFQNPNRGAPLATTIRKPRLRHPATPRQNGL